MAESEDEPAHARTSRRRPRGLAACHRCKTRKQRCDNDFPACSNCLAAGEKCSYGSKRAYPAEYVRSLELQVTRLQEAIDSPRQQGAASLTSGSSITRHQTLPTEDAHTVPSASDLEASAGIVAPSPDSFLGTSSGYPLTKLLRSAMNQFGQPSHASQLGSVDGSGVVRASSVSQHGRMRQAGDRETSSESHMPKQHVGDQLIEAYYARVHPKHPFLPRKRVQALHETRDSLVPAHKGLCSRQTLCDYATLQLVYAIGARYLQLTNDGDDLSPSQYYASAIADADVIFATRSLESIETMLLLTIYQLRSPTGPGVWWMIETTMRYCIDHGLHRQATNMAPSLDERRKRTFWTTYMLERSVARTMGRPHSISDRDIDVGLPANIDDNLQDDKDILAAIADSKQNQSQLTTLYPAIHIFRLQRIDSKIAHTVCRVDKDVSSIKPHKVAQLRNALEEWKAGIPNAAPETRTHPYLTVDYHMIQYHKSIILLNLPFLPSVTPKDPNFREIVDSAGQICCLSKRLHDQQTYISFSLLSLHANFVAGLVMVYCFCLDPSIFGPRFSSGVRACSTMLYIISERWPRAVQARNAFDRLVSATIESEINPLTQIQPPGADRETSSAAQALPQVGSGLGDGDNEEVWTTFESMLGDYQINMETWMHDSIFDNMSTFQPMDWTE